MEHENQNFIHTKNFQTILFLLVLGIFIFLCLSMIWPFIKAIAWSLALTIIAHPLYAFIGKKIKNKSLCSFLACVTVILLILIPAAFLFTWAAQETIELSKNAQEFMASGNVQKYINMPASKFTQIITRPIAKYVDLSKYSLEEKTNAALIDLAKTASSVVGKYSFIIVKNIAVSIFWIFLVFVITFFLLRDGEKALGYIRAFIPLEEEHKDMVFSRVKQSVRATIYGWIVIGLVQAALTGIMFAILGLSAPVLWGGITFLVSFVPLVGAPGVWVPACIVLLVKGMYIKAIIMFLWGMLVVSTADNFLRPILVGTKLHLHIIATFFAIFGGLLLMGPLGLIMGPVIFAVTLSLLDVFKHKLEEDES